MKKDRKTSLLVSISSLISFVLWTVLISFIDVKAIGPNGSSVGFATINEWFHELTGVHLTVYNITDWAGLVPIAFCLGFAVLGLVQWIRRKSILKVDQSILVLGGFYILTMAVYVIFESVVINYRPTLINGYLEVSYPSSTTLLVMCVMPTAIIQLNSHINNQTFRKIVSYSIMAFTGFVVIGRVISGVHWLTDIIGGALLSIGLVMMYRFVININK